MEGESAGPAARKAPMFRGAGYRLGEREEDPSDMVQGAEDHTGPKQVGVFFVN